MIRTSERPLVLGDITDKASNNFFCPFICSWCINAFVFHQFFYMDLTTLTFIFYGFIYTKYLKFMTSQNIVIGGLAGAMPPLLGWTAISNTIEPNALLLSSYYNGLDSSSFLGTWLFIELMIMLMQRFLCCLFKRGFLSQNNIYFLYSAPFIVATMLPYTVQMFGEIYLIAAFFWD